MQISEVSSEALCGITSWLLAHDIARLWMASPKQLRSKLEMAGGVQNWHLVSNPVVFPPMLPLFIRAQTIRLNARTQIQESLVTAEHLLMLPATMTFLELNFARGGDVFLGAYSSDLPRFSNLKTLILGHEVERVVKYAFPSTWPPNLETLRLRASQCFSTLVVSDLPSHLSTFSVSFKTGSSMTLPSTLTNLECLGIFLDVSHLVSALPCGLIHLSVLHPIWSDDWYPLPAGLKTLFCIFAKEIQWRPSSPRKST